MGKVINEYKWLLILFGGMAAWCWWLALWGNPREGTVMLAVLASVLLLIILRWARSKTGCGMHMAVLASSRMGLLGVMGNDGCR